MRGAAWLLPRTESHARLISLWYVPVSASLTRLWYPMSVHMRSGPVWVSALSEL